MAWIHVLMEDAWRRRQASMTRCAGAAVRFDAVFAIAAEAAAAAVAVAEAVAAETEADAAMA